MPLDKMPGSEQLVARDAMTSVKWIAIGVCCLWAGAANSSQTVAYTYDALGRLKQAQVRSGPEAGTCCFLSGMPSKQSVPQQRAASVDRLKEVGRSVRNRT